MAILDSFSIIMQTVGSIGMGTYYCSVLTRMIGTTAGPLVVVLAQALIPMTVVLSMIFLKVRYNPIQILGLYSLRRSYYLVRISLDNWRTSCESCS